MPRTKTITFRYRIPTANPQPWVRWPTCPSQTLGKVGSAAFIRAMLRTLPPHFWVQAASPSAHSLVKASPAASTSPSEGPAGGKDTSPSQCTGSPSSPLPFIQQLCPHNTHTQLIGYLGSAPSAIQSNLKASPPISPDNDLMAKYAIFPLSNRQQLNSFVKLHFWHTCLHPLSNVYVLVRVSVLSLRNEVIQFTCRAQPHCADMWCRDSQNSRVDWSVLMCFLEKAHFLTSIGLCYGEGWGRMFLPPFPLHGIKCPNRLRITASCLCRQQWYLPATEEKPKLF